MGTAQKCYQKASFFNGFEPLSVFQGSGISSQMLQKASFFNGFELFSVFQGSDWGWDQLKTIQKASFFNGFEPGVGPGLGSAQICYQKATFFNGFEQFPVSQGSDMG